MISITLDLTTLDQASHMVKMEASTNHSSRVWQIDFDS